MADILSSTRLVNRALIKVGGAESTQIIADITDTTKPLVFKIRSLMPDCLDAVLEALDWVEAAAYKSLGAAVTVSDDIKADWDYAFNKPTDCIQIREQVEQDNRRNRHECEVSGPYLLTNDLTNTAGDSAYVRYTFRLQDEAKMSQTMREAFVRKLAAEIAMILKPEKTDTLEKNYYDYIAVIAAGDNGRRRQPRTNDAKFTLLNPGSGIGLGCLGSTTGCPSSGWSPPSS